MTQKAHGRPGHHQKILSESQGGMAHSAHPLIPLHKGHDCSEGIHGRIVGSLEEAGGGDSHAGAAPPPTGLISHGGDEPLHPLAVSCPAAWQPKIPRPPFQLGPGFPSKTRATLNGGWVSEKAKSGKEQNSACPSPHLPSNLSISQKACF